MNDELQRYAGLLRESITQGYEGMYREAGGPLKFPFIVPGSQQYSDVLWDWDSWLTDVALRQTLREVGSAEELERARLYERGCILNFLHYCGMDGWMPILITRSAEVQKPLDLFEKNMHKPCLAQHAAFLIREDGGDAEWLREGAYALQCFVSNYRNHHRHECGLYFWQDDSGVGVDNDPCSFDRPPRSCGSIYLNTMMYRELLALAYILDRLQLDEIAEQYRADATALQRAIQEYCWDERDGFFYSVDFNLNPQRRQSREKHPGQLRDWPCLIMRLGVWSGFMALWSGVATPEQAERVAREHYRNAATFGAPFGVRSLSKMEKMYNLRASGNPSSWLGPIWGIANYLTFRGFVRYGLMEDARDLAEKTVRLFGRDVERFGAMHEYYQPENGEPILNRGFMNWNYLVLNMIAWLEGREPIAEF
jgi:putative isomerase